MRSIFECEHEGDSVVVWEAGVGHRIVFPVASMAEPVYEWLTGKATEFHRAKENKGVAVIFVFGEDQTPYMFIRRVLSNTKLAGYKVEEECMTRPASEFW